MGSGNWIVDNLNSALATWNEKLTEIWTLISTSPEEFKGGGIWDVILNIHDALRAIGYALLVLFFVAGVVKTCGSFTELKRPEVAVKTFVRFALAQGAVTYGLELMMTLFSIAQGAVSTIMDASGLTAMSDTALPDEMVTIIEDVGFLESIPLWAVTLLGSLFIWVLSLVMILTVYSRFFKLYMATAIAPIPLASFAGQPRGRPPHFGRDLRPRAVRGLPLQRDPQHHGPAEILSPRREEGCFSTIRRCATARRARAQRTRSSPLTAWDTARPSWRAEAFSMPSGSRTETDRTISRRRFRQRKK